MLKSAPTIPQQNEWFVLPSRVSPCLSVCDDVLRIIRVFIILTRLDNCTILFYQISQLFARVNSAIPHISAKKGKRKDMVPIPGQHINDSVHFERKGLYNIKKPPSDHAFGGELHLRNFIYSLCIVFNFLYFIYISDNDELGPNSFPK